MENNGLSISTFVLLLAMVTSIVYTASAWDSPNTGMSMVSSTTGVEYTNGLAVTNVVLNAIVAIFVINHAIGLSYKSGLRGGVSIGIGLSVVALVIIAAAGVNIANSVVVRGKRGDALGISSVVLSGLVLLPIAYMILTNAKSMM